MNNIKKGDTIKIMSLAAGMPSTMIGQEFKVDMRRTIRWNGRVLLRILIPEDYPDPDYRGRYYNIDMERVIKTDQKLNKLKKTMTEVK